MIRKNKLLLIESVDLFKHLYCLNIEMYLGIYDITIVNSAKDAISLLQEDNSYDLILTKNSLGVETTSIIIEKYLKESKKNIPLIVIGKRDMFSFGASFVGKSLDIQRIIRVLAGLLKITAKDMAEKSVDEYIPIPKKFMNELKWTNVDIYCNESKLLLSKDSMMESSIVSKIKGEYIYVYHLDRLKFANQFSKEIIIRLSEDQISTREQVMLAEVLNDESAVRISKFGLDTQTIEQSKKAQGIIENISRKTRGLDRLIGEFVDNRSSYRYRHTQICSFISLHILKQMEWSNDEQERKMAFVSFFNNITLPKDEYVKITSEEELRKANLNEDEKTLIKNHALKSAELVLQIPKTPMGVDQIIKQHHGSLTGTGFTNVYSGNISPLSMVFIVAEQFSHIILKDTPEFSFEKALVEIRERFPTKRFEKIINAVEKSGPAK